MDEQINGERRMDVVCPLIATFWKPLNFWIPVSRKEPNSSSYWMGTKNGYHSYETNDKLHSQIPNLQPLPS